jgi:thioredoxin 1
MQTEVITLDEHSFEQAVASASTPLVVNFWAPWCGSCQALTPSLSRLSREYAKRARFAEVNVDEKSALTRRFGVRTIPTIVVLHRGAVLGYTIGAQAAVRLRELVDEALQR